MRRGAELQDVRKPSIERARAFSGIEYLIERRKEIADGLAATDGTGREPVPGGSGSKMARKWRPPVRTIVTSLASIFVDNDLAEAYGGGDSLPLISALSFRISSGYLDW